jgi:type II secretory pathway component PulF
MTFMLIAFPTAMLLFVVPKMERIFRDFGTKLPQITQILLNTSRWFNTNYIWFVLWPIPVAVGFLLPAIKPTFTTPPSTRLQWTHRFSLVMVTFCIVGGMLMFFVIALLAPMISLMQAVSSPKH